MVLASPIKFCQGLCLVIFMGTSLVHVSKSSQYFVHRLSDFDLSNFLSDPGAGIQVSLEPFALEYYRSFTIIELIQHFIVFVTQALIAFIGSFAKIGVAENSIDFGVASS